MIMLNQCYLMCLILKMIKDNVIACSHIFDQIDILVYSAGIHLENADFFKITPEEYDRVMNINIRVLILFAESSLNI